MTFRELFSAIGLLAAAHAHAAAGTQAPAHALVF
ncbi:MAG: hypothetical protein RIR43_2463 [Pseudomonadota bacterium]|jgi:hypothetical protein